MGIFKVEKKDQCSICGEFYVACYKLKDKSKICKNCIKKMVDIGQAHGRI